MKFLFLQTTDGTLTLLEITNRNEIRPIIEEIDVAHRSTPTTIMLYTSLKGIIIIILNFVALFFVTLAGWEVVDGNKRHAATSFITKTKIKSQPEPEQ